jgi:hypothetical protein
VLLDGRNPLDCLSPRFGVWLAAQHADAFSTRGCRGWPPDPQRSPAPRPRVAPAVGRACRAPHGRG